ncbi:MAG TPA: class I SAM-dependent methyltransferase [Terriglobales bacterium]|nr:class I SAM-dependent methyltransferase [Terriglobales bacterium]
MKPSQDVLDPVAAYERVAPFFPEISLKRKRYLESIDQLILSRIPSGSRSLLDVGAGDGKRGVQLAGKAAMNDVVLLEPSAAMMKEAAARIWKCRVEDLGHQHDRQFDVITCLWNVLGHIRPAKTRVEVLCELGRLLSADGLLFLDVNYRYNVSSYGVLRTVGRFLYDQLRPGELNGDVTVTWNFEDLSCRTYGHVFTDREIRQLAADADLIVEERLIVDYDTGEVKRRGWQGNLFYVLRRRSSSSDAVSVSQTS